MELFIDRLEQEIWNFCVTRIAPENIRTEYRWRSDETAYLMEGFCVGKMPENLRPLLNKALLQWNEISVKMLSDLSISKNAFLESFYSARTSYLNGGREWENFIFASGSAVRGVVKNMDWVNLFSWILPVADSGNSELHIANGRMVASVFYSELLLKYGRNPDLASNNPLGKIETRWWIAHNNMGE